MGSSLKIVETIDGKEVSFEFPALKPEEAAMMLSKIKSRHTYTEFGKKELERIRSLPFHDQDPEQMFLIEDRITKATVEMSKQFLVAFERFSAPAMSEILTYLDRVDLTDKMVSVFQRSVSMQVPSEEDRKKS